MSRRQIGQGGTDSARRTHDSRHSRPRGQTLHLDTDGWIYFIWSSEQDAVKIGFTQQPQERQSALQMGNPSDLDLLDCIRAKGGLEGKIHQKFAELHLRNEWFNAGEEIFSFLDELEGLRRDHVAKLHESEPGRFQTIEDILEAIDDAVLPEADILALPVQSADSIAVRCYRG